MVLGSRHPNPDRRGREGLEMEEEQDAKRNRAWIPSKDAGKIGKTKVYIRKERGARRAA